MAVKHRKLNPNYGDYFPPLPPPPPLPRPSSGERSLSIISQNAIISVAVVASFALLLTYYIVVVKRCFGLTRRRPARTRGLPGGENQEFLDGNRGPVVDHPIWYIRTIGLQPSVINSITILKYKVGGGLIEGTECSVCLSEFREDETLRLLPKCNHAFHIRCIDTWLRSHTNCPLCRAAVVSTAVTPARNSNPLGSTGNELNQAESISAGRHSDSDAGNGENRETVDDEDRPEIQESNGVDGGKTVEIVNGNINIAARAITRRSLSVDSSIVAEVAEKVEGEASQSNNGRNSRNQRMIGGGSIAECLHKRPVLMKRSFSYGGRSVFSRH